MKLRILEVLSKESNLDYIELYKKVANKEMIKNKYMRSQVYPQVLKEMVEEGLIAENGFIVRRINFKMRNLPTHKITNKGLLILNENEKEIRNRK